MSRIKTIFVVATVIGLFLLASTEDFEDEIRERQQYCKDVKAGYPDYKNIYEEECQDEK